MIRVFLVDDHVLVRTGFRMILAAEVGMQVIGEAANGEDALPQIRKLKPDVVICDLHLPGVSGLEITKRIVQADYGSRVIIVTVQEDGPMPKRLLDAGASGYLGKGCAASELLHAVREVSRGKRYLGSDVAQKLALDRLSGETSPFDTLTRRELEIAMLVCQGIRMEDIAKRLSLSPKTVATHKYNTFDKLGVQDAIALSRLASQYGLTEAH